MKTINKIIFALLVLAVFTAGCKKALDEQTFTNLNQTIFPKTAGDLRVLCNGLYNMFEVNEHYGRSYIIMSDLFSDEVATNASSGPRYEIDNFQITPGNTETTRAWVRNFTIISRANVIIQKAPLIGLPDQITRPYIAEARFIRALCYFELVRFFGDVSLILQSQTNLDSLQVLKPHRTPQNQVYAQIIADLQYAQTYLPKENDIPSSYKGTASSGAATSLLAKAYLTRAYMPFAAPDDFSNAAVACEQVINSAQYNLFANYADVFDVNKKNGIEHIFSIQYDKSPNNAGALTGFYVPQEVYPYAFGVFPVERKFYDSFPSNDVVRKKYVFFDRGTGLTGVNYDYLTTPTSTPYCGKYRDDVSAAVGFNDRCNFPILRYADVLLMHSEALNRINPADNNKYNGINKVRARVNLSPLSGLGQPDFENAVLDERHWELCFEGQRRPDLIRLGKLVSVMTALGKTNIHVYNKYYPVPQTEIDINQNLLPQNQGY
jgi:hypothetical protein